MQVENGEREKPGRLPRWIVTGMYFFVFVVKGGGTRDILSFSVVRGKGMFLVLGQGEMV